MNDSDTNIAELKKVVKKFCEERDWDQYHNPKDLAVGLILEAAELIEPFRFKPADEAEAIIRDPAKKPEIEDEMSDILYFLLRMAQLYDIDIASAFERKMEKTSKKYSVSKFKGVNKKYNEL